MVDEDARISGGRFPICTSEGFSWFGKATPIQGLTQVVEIVWYLRGEAVARQIKDAEVGMVDFYGAGANNTGIILKR